MDSWSYLQKHTTYMNNQLLKITQKLLRQNEGLEVNNIICVDDR